MRTGLVLGAGGTVGRAFHLAMLSVLEGEWGWQANQADIVVGTSAGSLTGACIRSGASVDDLLCEATHGDLEAAQGTLAGIGPAPLPPPPCFAFGRPPVTLRDLRARARKDTPLRWTTAALSLVPRGRGCTDEHAAWVDRLVQAPWTDRPLWVCAVEMPALERTIWGRSPQHDPPIGTAVAASCAVPGYLAPRIHRGREYVDGGLHSATNADALAGTALDRVIISSPMSVTGPHALTPAERIARHLRHRTLHEEVRTLRRDGKRVVVVEPTAEELEAMRGVHPQAPLREDTLDALQDHLRRRLRAGAFDGFARYHRRGGSALT
jgi:NTE family protein